MRAATFFFPLILAVILPFLGASIPSFAEVKPAKKTYICNAGNAIWNQTVPCDQDTPERQQIMDRIAQAKPTLIPTRSAPIRQSVTLTELKNYPEKFALDTVKIEDLWLYGAVRRSMDPLVPDGRKTVVLLENVQGGKQAFLISDTGGARFSQELSPDQRYSVASVTVELMKTSTGFMPFIKGMKLGDDPSELVDVPIDADYDPLIRTAAPPPTATSSGISGGNPYGEPTAEPSQQLGNTLSLPDRGKGEMPLNIQDMLKEKH